ncbi:MAG: UDP-N-acetylmuramoyl-L-alanyl-D-glutamate--2,6-diaminopimelate ligase [Oscillospiraceae bacterium]|nr:UDP-N-acetylmuramoyl-L-alanyl-D-glutamate--2,6-diaminopimelate ligase [Oscillospiraceae bacterium]
MRLYALLEGNAETGLEDREINGITSDSRKVQEGYLFVCIKGEHFDGHTVAAEMLEKGAAAVIAERDLGLGRQQILVPDTHVFYGQLCAAWFDHPEQQMKFIGVTGTNGKTTITNVIKHILTANGYLVGLIGTIQNEIGDQAFHTNNTTPMVYDLMALYRKMADAGCDYVVMEVSSFGLVQHRIGPTHFCATVFTNLTQDHLDYHKTMESYYQAKRMLFDITDYALINTDDAYGKRLAGEVSCAMETYGNSSSADYYADAIKLRANGTSFWLCYSGKSYPVTMQMTGMFNVYNVIAACAVCMELGLSNAQVLQAVQQCRGVRGRCEVIPTGKPFSVICDYAHTPDAIENILRSVKEYTEGRLICLFGCGGNRDKTKRPKMARAAATYADFLMITSDNPRDEDPEAIIQDILTGLEGTSVPYEIVVDRKEAILRGMQLAKPGDVLVLAGKGHEDYQILANKVHIHMDEREIVAECLTKL